MLSNHPPISERDAADVVAVAAGVASGCAAAVVLSRVSVKHTLWSTVGQRSCVNGTFGQWFYVSLAFSVGLWKPLYGPLAHKRFGCCKVLGTKRSMHKDFC